MSLIQATGRQQTSLRGWSVWYIGPSVPLRRESPTTVTCLFFLLVVVVIQGVDLSDLSNISGVHGPSCTSSLVWHSTSRSSYLLYRGTWECEVGKEGLHLSPFFRSLLSFKLLPSVCRGGEYRILQSCFFSCDSSCVCLRQGRA